MLTFGGLVHDIGKLSLPPELVYKENLSYDEEKELQTHVIKGAELLQTLGTSPSVVSVVLQHHERFDGQGYPLGLIAERIHLFAKIVAVADTFDNLTSKRPGGNPISLENAVEELKKMEGRFDPSIVRTVSPADTLKDHKKKVA